MLHVSRNGTEGFIVGHDANFEVLSEDSKCVFHHGEGATPLPPRISSSRGHCMVIQPPRRPNRTGLWVAAAWSPLVRQQPALGERFLSGRCPPQRGRDARALTS
jgi:hypothetical protein